MQKRIEGLIKALWERIFTTVLVSFFGLFFVALFFSERSGSNIPLIMWSAVVVTVQATIFFVYPGKELRWFRFQFPFINDWALKPILEVFEEASYNFIVNGGKDNEEAFKNAWKILLYWNGGKLNKEDWLYKEEVLPMWKKHMGKTKWEWGPKYLGSIEPPYRQKFLPMLVKRPDEIIGEKKKRYRELNLV